MLCTRPIGTLPPRASKSSRPSVQQLDEKCVQFLPLTAAALAGCGEERVVYDRLDAGAWGPRCTTAGIPDGGLGYVSNSLMNSIAVLDLAAGAVRGTHPVGVGPLAENGPHHLAVDVAHERGVQVPMMPA